MHPRALDVLHNAGDQHGLPVAYRIHLHLAPLEILVYQHPPARARLESAVHVAHDLGSVLDDLHRAPAEHVARPDQYRIADLLGNV